MDNNGVVLPHLLPPHHTSLQSICIRLIPMRSFCLQRPLQIRENLFFALGYAHAGLLDLLVRPTDLHLGAQS